MRNYYNYLSGEDEDIGTAKAFYIICLNPGLQTYKVVASPQALNTLQKDPETNIAQYWPITREQIDNAPQHQIFYGNDIRKAPFSLDQIQACFGFNPQTILPSQFGPPAPAPAPAPVQQQIPALIQQAINLAGLDAERLQYINRPACIAAIQAGTVNIPWLAGRTRDQLRCITNRECIQAMQGPHPIFTMGNLTPLDAEQLRYITRPACIAAIQAGIFNIPWLAGRTSDQLYYITSRECIQAMQGPHPIFTMENLTPFDHLQLFEITQPECIAAIQAGTFNMPWLARRTSIQLRYITSRECIQAMQGPHPIFTMENLTPLDADQFLYITSPTCIEDIQGGIVTIEQLTEMTIDQLF